VSDLFESKAPAPLAERMRPTSLDEYVGQEEIVRAVKRLLDRPPSMIFWGPPGCGKTTLARLVAAATGLHFQQFSAVTSGIKEVREAIDQAKWRRLNEKKGTILFVDEIHRFNRAQQDAFLPHLEDGTIVMIGATTENPSFEVNAPLLSRCRVFTLKPHPPEQVLALLRRACEREKIQADDDALRAVADLAGGDARAALTLLEMGGKRLTADAVRELAQKKILLHDRDREQHYDVVSALIKSMRGSDVDAALYWLARLIEGGEDPMFIARRLVIFASEDVGNADPRGIMVAVAAKDAVHFVGLPEGFYPLAQATVYLATAPKSNAAGAAYLEAKADVEKSPNEPVPLHLRNAPTALMKSLGYGQGYQYAHDRPWAVVEHGHRPPSVEGREYYKPTERGHEAAIRKLMEERRKRK
jgi:putative ATPase